jgi:dihydroneopterin aldolase
MYTISLHGVQIHAALGLYPEELLTGNEFDVDLDVWTSVDPSEGFIDYVVLNDLIREGFEAGNHTLEAICRHIQFAIRDRFDFAKRIRVCIRKLHPPMKGRVGYAQVCIDN